MDIFFSRPNDLGQDELKTIKAIEEVMNSRDLNLRTIGSTDFPNEVPMVAVANVMKECKGAIIMGFKQIKIENGCSKIGTDKEVTLNNKFLPTVWNNIEATMAFMLDLPLLIIRDREIEGGIFDVGVTNNFIHTFDLETSDWINEKKFLQPFNEWYKEIIKKN